MIKFYPLPRLVKYTLALLLLLGTSPIFTQDTLSIEKSTDFIIDGYGTNPAWQQADWISLTHLDEQDEQATRFKSLYSELGIYFLFFCEDAKITATYLHDFSDLWKEDVVEIFLWPDTNFTIYFEYELSPKNIELPIIVPNLNGNFLGWRPWKYEGDRKVLHETSVQMKTTSEGAEIEGWTAEFFVPFKLLEPLVTKPVQAGDIWRGNLYRVDHDTQRPIKSAWQPVETRFHEFRKFGFLAFK